MLSQKTLDQQEHKIELADIFHIHGPAYRDKFGHNMLPSHQRAMEDIEHCRTEELGGHVFFCDTCDDYRYSYHSCKNRNCPKCGHENAQLWLDKQKTRFTSQSPTTARPPKYPN